MDFLDIIITIAILAAGGLLSGRKNGKKTSPQTAAPDPTPRPVFETLFEDDDEIEDLFGDEIEEQTEYENVDTSTQTQDNPHKEYFSYENPDSNTLAEDINVKPENKIDDVPSEQGLFDGRIDLRRAFIYQTILERVDY